MKPANTRPALLLQDGAPVTCYFMAWAGMPVGHERCEQDATERLDSGALARFQQWKDDHPRAIIMLYPGPAPFLCDVHLQIIRDCL